MSPRYFIVIMLLFISVACTTQRSPSLTVTDITPVSDLPININLGERPDELPTPVSDAVIQEADAEYLLLSNIYERSTPSVVNIEADLPGNTAENPNVSRGSGFVYDTFGHIITNAHVIQNAQSIRVTFNDGYVTLATIVGIDNFSDLGLLQVNVEPLRLMPLNLSLDSDAVRVGQRAIAIGNPFGLSSSMTVGIVSGIGRNLRSAELIDANAPIGFQNPAIIQTDAPLNPGNSGGPLLNSQGDVIGVTTAIRTENGIFQGVGFAVPANTVRRVIPDLIAQGHVSYAWIGISVQPEDNGYGVAGLAEALNLPVTQGVLVRGVTVNGPADDAGIRGGTNTAQVRGQSVCIGGDIIVAIDGEFITDMDDLVSYLIVNTRPGDTVTLLIVRNRQTFSLSVQLRERPATDGVVRDCAG